MKWDAAYVGDFKLTVQKIVDFLTKILKEVFGFIEEEEGWTTTEEVAGE